MIKSKLLTFSAFALLCATSLTGCKTFSAGNAAVAVAVAVAPVAVEVASCQLAARKPAAKQYLLLAGEVFLAFSGGDAPTPAELESALSNLPDSPLTKAEQSLVWSSSVAAYRAIYRPALTLDQQERIRDLLQRVGLALVAGSDCATRDMIGGALKPADIQPLDQSIAHTLK